MLLKNSKICILVPFYNEEKYLPDVVKELKKVKYPIFFVNDGSTDNSLKAVYEHYRTYTYYPNKGKGFAVKHAAERLIKQGYDYILTFDADKQNTITDIPEFITRLRENPDVKIIMGNRYWYGKPKNQSLFRYIGNTIISYLTSRMAGQFVGDSQCGMRLYHKDIFKIPTITNRYDYETEILIRAGRKGYKIVNTPVECIYIEGRKNGLQISPFIVSLIKLYFKLRKK